MIKIEKSKDEHGYNFNIATESGSFTIFFAGNLDLYWRYNSQNILEEIQKSFIITKEHFEFFSLIDTLYNKIKNCDVSYDNEPNQELQNYLIRTNKTNPHKLFKNNKVEWHSDDYTYEESAVLEIEQIDESYKITFNRGRTDVEQYVFSIRFCNSGSRYHPFNVLFMKMYNGLKNYDDEYHQIHIEEYLYDLKRTRKK